MTVAEVTALTNKAKALRLLKGDPEEKISILEPAVPGGTFFVGYQYVKPGGPVVAVLFLGESQALANAALVAHAQRVNGARWRFEMVNHARELKQEAQLKKAAELADAG